MSCNLRCLSPFSVELHPASFMYSFYAIPSLPAHLPVHVCLDALARVNFCFKGQFICPVLSTLCSL